MRHEDEPHKLPDDKVGEDEPDDLQGHKEGQREYVVVIIIHRPVEVVQGLDSDEEGGYQLAGGKSGMPIQAQDVVDPGKNRRTTLVSHVCTEWVRQDYI